MSDSKEDVYGNENIIFCTMTFAREAMISSSMHLKMSRSLVRDPLFPIVLSCGSPSIVKTLIHFSIHCGGQNSVRYNFLIQICYVSEID